MSNSLEVARLWHAVLGRLELDITPANFETWLRPTRPQGLHAGKLIVEAPSSFAANHLNESLGVVASRAVEMITGSPVAVEFVPRGSAAPGGVSRAPFAAPVMGTVCPNYRFDTFHVGEGNRRAVDACRAVAEGRFAVSPVLLWGAPGVGKTHLLHATAAEACLGGAPAACLSAEEFTTRYMSAVRRESVDEFQRTFRRLRLLLVDDVEYLVGKRGTIEEFTHTMDAVLHAGGGIVVATMEPPARLAFPDRLKSRLLAGSVVQLASLQGEERLQFIRAVASELRARLPDWAMGRIAAMEAGTMRLLRGAVCVAVGLQRAGQLDERRLDAELVRMGGGAPALSDDEVIEQVAAYFGVKSEEIAGRSRSKAVRDARAVTVAVLKRRGRSLSQLASRFGHRDPSTVSGLAERGKALLERMPELERSLAG